MLNLGLSQFSLAFMLMPGDSQCTNVAPHSTLCKLYHYQKIINTNRKQ